jgi:hypothetical protein
MPHALPHRLSPSHSLPTTASSSNQLSSHRYPQPHPPTQPDVKAYKAPTKAPPRTGFSLLVFPAQNSSRSILQLLLQELIHRKRDRLAGRNAHNTGRDALIEGVNAFLSIKYFSPLEIIEKQFFSLCALLCHEE